jgi:serine/threonine-protein kinase
MAAPSATTFADVLRRHHLLDPAQLAEVQQTLLVQFSDPKALLTELVRRAWLTPYQAEQLVLGVHGVLVLGSYVLLERLGEGGMGQVFKARNWKLGHVVALKLVKPERTHNEAILRRFRREIQLASQLHHPNVVRALDADEVGGTCLLAMEYVEGTDLARLVRRRGSLPVQEACEYVRQAALGLQHAHERGLIHRDIKPHNLLLAKDGTVKVLDLGLARIAAGDGSTTLTKTGAVMGTPDYIAPEQALDSKHADIRSDLYSLGCTLYFLLTGQTPFGGGTMAEKLMRHQLAPIPDVRVGRPEVPVGVAAVLARLMAKRPEERYQTPAELIAVLAEGLHSGRWPAMAVPEAESSSTNPWAEVTDPATPADGKPTPQSSARRHAWSLLAGLTVAGLGFMVLAVFLALRLSDWTASTEKTEANGVTVAADGGWQDTGVDLLANERFRVKATGMWKKGDSECPASGLPDEPRDRALVPTAPLMALLARIGDDPELLSVPEDALTAPHAGRLYLRANDLDPVGKTGSLQITVSGGNRSGRVLPPPAPTVGEEAEAVWRDLRGCAADPTANPEALRQELLAFRSQFSGAPQMGQVNVALAGVLARLPSPLDHLRSEDISEAERKAAEAAANPATMARLVAVWGDSRLRAWSYPFMNTLFDPKGKLLASSCVDDPAITLWDLPSGQLRHRLPSETGPWPMPGQFFPSGDRLAVLGGGSFVEIWDIRTGKRLRKLDCQQGAVDGLAISSDGKRLATGGNGGDWKIRLWDGEGRGPLQVLTGHTNWPMDTVFGPGDQTLASGSRDGSARLWDLATGKDRVFPGGKTGDSNYYVLLSPGGKTLALGSQTSVRLWDVDRGPSSGRDLPDSSCLGGMTFLDGGKVLAVVHNNVVQFWTSARTSCRAPCRLPAPPPATTALARTAVCWPMGRGRRSSSSTPLGRTPRRFLSGRRARLPCRPWRSRRMAEFWLSLMPARRFACTISRRARSSSRTTSTSSPMAIRRDWSLARTNRCCSPVPLRD